MKRIIITFALVLMSAGVVEAQFGDVGMVKDLESVFTGGIGLTTITQKVEGKEETKTYINFNLSPELRFGKLGIGLNINLLFDDEGLRTDEYKGGVGVLRAVRYVRYGYKGEEIYVHAGNLTRSMLGHGFIMYQYNNSISYDDRKIGINFDMDFDLWGFETVTSNVRDFEILGVRAYYRPLRQAVRIPIIKNLEVGGTFVTDRADPPKVLVESIEEKDLVKLIKEPVTIWGLDIGLPLIDSPYINSTLYYDFADILDIDAPQFEEKSPGDGQAFGLITNINLVADVFALSAKLERRLTGENFLPNYFNALYERTRFPYESTRSKREKSRKEQLVDIPEDAGIYGELYGDLIGKVRLGGSLQWQDEAPESGVLHLEAIAHEAMPKFTIYATYDKQEIGSAEDAFTLNENSVFTVRTAYKVYPFMLAGVIYRWNFVLEEETGEYKVQKRVEPFAAVTFNF